MAAGYGSPWTIGKLVFDTSSFIWKANGREAVLELEKLRKEFIVEIVKTDVVDEELSEKYHERIGDEFDNTTSYVEAPSIFYNDASRLGHAVLGTDEEHRFVEEIARVLKPCAAVISSNDFRDARHLAAARKYGCLAFVTTDGNILKRAPELLDKWQIKVLTPELALEMVLELVRRRDLLEKLKH